MSQEEGIKIISRTDEQLPSDYYTGYHPSRKMYIPKSLQPRGYEERNKERARAHLLKQEQDRKIAERDRQIAEENEIAWKKIEGPLKINADIRDRAARDKYLRDSEPKPESWGQMFKRILSGSKQMGPYTGGNPDEERDEFDHFLRNEKMRFPNDPDGLYNAWLQFIEHRKYVERQKKKEKALQLDEQISRRMALSFHRKFSSPKRKSRRSPGRGSRRSPGRGSRRSPRRGSRRSPRHGSRRSPGRK